MGFPSEDQIKSRNGIAGMTNPSRHIKNDLITCTTPAPPPPKSPDQEETDTRQTHNRQTAMSIKVMPAIDLLRPSPMERHSSEPSSLMASFSQRTSSSPLAPTKRQVVVVLGGSFSGISCVVDTTNVQALTVLICWPRPSLGRRCFFSLNNRPT